MVDALIVMVALLLVVGVLGAVSTGINGVLRSLMGSAGCGNMATTGPPERAHAEVMLAHFEEIRAAAIAGDWELFHALNAELQTLDPRAWAEFNDGLEAANIPQPAAAKPRRGAG